MPHKSWCKIQEAKARTDDVLVMFEVGKFLQRISYIHPTGRFRSFFFTFLSSSTGEVSVSDNNNVKNPATLTKCKSEMQIEI